MHTVVELPEYIKRAEKLLAGSERSELINFLATNPKAGDLIQGTRGVRKIRWKRQGSGKSSGFRVVYFFHNESIPLFLLTIFGKNEKTNLTQSERNDLAKLCQLIIRSYKR